jgi:hypothetical protein
VVPRGRGVAAKFLTGGNSCYLGYFEDKELAARAYDDAKSRYEHDVVAQAPVPSLSDAEWLNSIRQKRSKLLAAKPPPAPVERRARNLEANLASAQANDRLVAAAKHRYERTKKLYEQIVVVEDGVAPDYYFVHQYVPACVEIKILRRVRAESQRRPPRHRRDACSMAWRCRFLAARRNQRGHAIAET